MKSLQPRTLYSYLLSPVLLYTPNLDHLLTTNDPPSELDVSFIRDIVVRSQNELDDVSLVSTSLDNIRRRLEDFVRLHRSIISPIRRLPGELLCEIFVWTMSSNSNQGWHSIHVPWSLGAVCCRWRRYAVSCQMLW
ncbi:hypothetical protein DFH06DRAFT_1023821, partial [Mycena polygramma]